MRAACDSKEVAEEEAGDYSRGGGQATHSLHFTLLLGEEKLINKSRTLRRKQKKYKHSGGETDVYATQDDRVPTNERQGRFGVFNVLKTASWLPLETQRGKKLGSETRYYQRRVTVELNINMFTTSATN